MESDARMKRRRGRTPPLRRSLPLLLAAASAVCAVGDPRPSRTTPRGDITRLELERTPTESAYQAVERLRPTWLFHRRTPTIANPDPEPTVYVDQAKLPTLDVLRSVPAQDVEVIRFLSSRRNHDLRHRPRVGRDRGDHPAARRVKRYEPQPRGGPADGRRS